MNIPHYFQQYLYVFLFSLFGLFIGFLIEKIFISRIQIFAVKTKWKFDDIIISSLNKLITIWFFVLAFSISANRLIDNSSVLSFSNKTTFAIFILTVSIFTGRVLIKFIKLKTADVSGNSPSTSIIQNIIRVIVFLIGIMLILRAFGISIAPILTALGVGGLAVALALQETLSNLFAGIQIIASKKIRNGDYIKLDSGQEGYVMDITWRNTIIRAIQNNLIIIPNSKLSSAIITNYNFPENELSVIIQVGVSYDSDLDVVEKLTIETAKEVMQLFEGGIKNFEPFIRYHTFSDSSINFSVILRGFEFENQFLLKHEFIKALQKKYKLNSIEIPFPIRTVHLKSNSQA
ncbi:MAG: mechanosensitive ion channel family protein [Bacteroidota bacterium]|nr:mechanosensitive ion channel family protein [Bacteroidota bacterium]MDP3145906.1 mechanosensitive ion channel family protein [Bacteroidota bacterium]